MKLQADLFPYPVLSSELDDYVDSYFTTKIDYNILSPTKVSLLIDFELSNEDIKALINKEMACFAIHLEGVASSYRELVKVPFGDTKVEVILSAKHVNSKIEINTMILAETAISNYRSSKFNLDYYDLDYVIPNIQKGDILAYSPMYVMTLELDNIEGQDNSSMIRVAAKDEQYMTIDLDGDLIYVFLPKKAYEVYINLSNMNTEYEQLLLLTIIQPTLIYVIDKIQSGFVNDHNLKWFTSLTRLITNLGYNEQDLYDIDSLKLAQELLDMPVEKALYEFYEVGERSVQ